MFVNWLKGDMTQEELDKKMISASMRDMDGLVIGLLCAGANVEARDESENMTGITVATNRGNVELVETFLKYGSFF